MTDQGTETRIEVEVDDERLQLTPDEVTDYLEYDEDRLADQRAVLESTRLRILHAILATETGSLSAPEVAVRVPITESTVRDHLREMSTRDPAFVEKLTVESEKRQKDIPYTFYAVSEYGINLLKEVRMYSMITPLYQMYSRMDYGNETDRIRRIEDFDNRPVPDWI